MSSPEVPPEVPVEADEPVLLLGPMLRHVDRTTATVWVETSAPCVVRVLSTQEPTFTVAGHHYAIVVVTGLRPGSGTEYGVELDGRSVWPVPDGRFPPSVMHTRGDDDGPVRVSFGSCRYACPGALTEGSGLGPDALDALARHLLADPAVPRPDLLLLLGDQVYADETTTATVARIAQRRGGESRPQREVADFEEYTWLYHESWTDPEVRWLFSTVPTAMIFDDHDVHDDWNTSGSWRRDSALLPWWPERIIGALQSYWVYQHLGNLSPAELAAEPTLAALRALPAGKDGEPLLRELAIAADAEADGAKGYRWSFRRDLGRTRVVVLDSRCGRIVDTPTRTMLGAAEMAWFAEQLDDDGYDHLMVGTSLPWLLAPALHAVEAWDERLAVHPGRRRAGWGERLRRAADLEHWAAFTASFDQLADLLGRVADGTLGGRGRPASVSVLSGDVHHSYVARAERPGAVDGAAPIHQVTCSPLHNRVPAPMRLAFRISWSRLAETTARLLLGRLGSVPRPSIGWHRVGGGPWFGNALATLLVEGPRLRLRLDSSEQPPGGPPLRPLAEFTLTQPPP